MTSAIDERQGFIHLAVDEGSDGEVPGGVGGHAEAEEGPDAVVVEGGYEHGGGAARAEYVRPRPLVQPVIDVVDVAAMKKKSTVSPLSSSSDTVTAMAAAINRGISTHLAQAISWMTEPKRRNVQLKASPAAFQYGPRSPSRTSNHWSTSQKQFNFSTNPV
jgi:hypothetical protein